MTQPAASTIDTGICPTLLPGATSPMRTVRSCNSRDLSLSWRYEPPCTALLYWLSLRMVEMFIASLGPCDIKTSTSPRIEETRAIKVTIVNAISHSMEQCSLYHSLSIVAGLVPVIFVAPGSPMRSEMNTELISVVESCVRVCD